jgi:large subunit ribosomal protein L4
MATKTVKPVKKVAPKKAAPKVKAATSAGLSATVFAADGKESGKVALPAELFGAEVNKALLSQSVRVYLANQRQGGAKAKTRGEVEGSSRKIYRQKGTGKARHGSIRAHIFVGGGVVFGPVTRDFHLKMSKSMRRLALVSALSAKRQDIVVVDGLESVAPKTKSVAAALAAAGATEKVLLIVPKDTPLLSRAARNINDLDIVSSKDLHTYAILTHKKIVFTKKSLEESKAHFTVS